MPQERPAGLLAAKLRALVVERWGPAERAPATFPRGAALVGAGEGFVLADGTPDRALGPALVWAERAGGDALHLLVDRDTGVAGALARRAAAFRRDCTVWEVEGRATEPAIPAPPDTIDAVPAAAADLAAVLADEGLEVVVEDGGVRGELLGLEVARVVEDVGGAWLEVGVGKHDREAMRLVHGDEPSIAALHRAADYVRTLRRADAEPHPLNRLAAERWLRALLIASPARIGATALAPLPCPVARPDLRLPAPAPAGGIDGDGRSLVVVCSTGIDVDLVPIAADARLAFDPDARLVLVVPERDDHPVTRSLAAALHDAAEIRTVPNDWRHALSSR
jgi:hypothetical protein